MGTSIANEVYVFLGMVCLGVCQGLLFDVFRIFRRVAKPGVVAVNISDMLFWVVSAVLIAGGFLFFNNGQLRWHVFLGLFLGAVFYFLLLSRYIILAAVKIIEGFLKIFHLFLKILLTPLGFLYKITIVPLCAFWKVLYGKAAHGIQSFCKRGKAHGEKNIKQKRKAHRHRIVFGSGLRHGHKRRDAAAQNPGKSGQDCGRAAAD